ncbi:hypothetical protein [uncultured Clostridium sp.]|uniref:hypothetical protein n=1 Tax=uncultured Clostridium sp. TaxID=59620 RepID=UPI0028F0F335|nr:hypothetical protein [uncultured Clostridium sp.]
MKKNTKKLISLILFFVIGLTFTKYENAYAFVDNSSNWGFGIMTVGNAKRMYLSNNTFTCDPDQKQDVSGSGKTYDMKTKEVALITKLTSDFYSSYYVNVDGRFIGESSDQDIFYKNTESGKSNYTTIIIKNLTPGKHKISVKSDKPFNISGGPIQKEDFLYVNIPVVEDEKIKNSIEQIKNGNAKLSDYTIVGVDKDSIGNLNLLNVKIKDKDLNAGNVQQTTIDILNSIKKELNENDACKTINSGNGTLNSYKTIGIEIKSDVLKSINSEIIKSKNNKNADLTVDEIINVVNTTLKNIDEANERINQGQAKLNDYLLVGAVNVTEVNLLDINDGVKGKDNTTLNKLQGNINKIFNALKYINEGNTSLSNYNILGITSVSSKNINELSKVIVAKKNKKGQDLTKEEINNIIIKLPDIISGAFKEINAGQGTLEDYQLVGSLYVTDINLVDVNWYVNGKDNNTLSKLQGNINTIKNALNYINDGNTNTSYYKTLEITTVNENNAPAVKNGILIAKKAKGNNLTKAEIEKVVLEALNNVSSSYVRINAGQGTLEDYQLVGASNVTDINLIDVNWYVKGKDNSTLKKLQGNINTIFNALKYINGGDTSASYYKILEITTINANNAPAVKNGILIAKKAKGNNLTKAEIEKVVSDALNDVSSSYVKINAGQGTLDDYKVVGSSNVTDITLVDVNWYVNGKDNSTLSKLQGNINTISNALKYINNGSTNTSYYKILGITTVNANNESAVKTGILAAKKAKGNNLTKAEIEKVVLEALNNVSNSYVKINAGQGTLEDYQLVGASYVTDINLVDVNWYVKGKDNSTLSKLQGNINTIKNALNYINGGTTTASYYEALGIKTVNANNSLAVKARILAAKKAKGNNLTKVEIEKVVSEALNDVSSSYVKINAGQGTLEDYQLVGASYVTDINLVDVNWYVKGKDNSTLKKLQENINTIKNALNYINSGTTTVSYYEALGIKTVNSNNASAVKTAILAAKKEKKNNLTKSEIEKVVEDTLNVKVVRARSILMEEPKIEKTVNENKLNEEKVKEVTNSKVDDVNKKEESNVSQENMNAIKLSDKLDSEKQDNKKTNVEENIDSTKSSVEKVDLINKDDNKQEVKENKKIDENQQPKESITEKAIEKAN